MKNIVFILLVSLLLASCGGGGGSSGSSTPTTDTPAIEENNNYIHTVEELTEYKEDGTSLVTKTYYEYDDLGNVLSKKVDRDNDGTFEFVDIYYREPNGDIYQEEHYFDEDLVDMTEYFYDEDSNGNKVIEIEAMMEKILKVVDVNNNILEEEYYPMDIGTLDYAENFEYKKIHTYSPTGDKQFHTVYKDGSSTPLSIYYANGDIDYGADGTIDENFLNTGISAMSEEEKKKWEEIHTDFLSEEVISWLDNQTKKITITEKSDYGMLYSNTEIYSYDHNGRLIGIKYDEGDDGFFEKKVSYGDFIDVDRK